MRSNDVIEVVKPIGGGISEVTLFPDAAAVLAGTAGVLVERGRIFHADIRYRSSLRSDDALFVRRVEIPVIGRDGEISGVLCRNLPLTGASSSTPLTQDQDTPTPRINSNMITKFLRVCLVIATTTVTAETASATTAYDGSWALTIYTRRGTCDPTYNFQVEIRNDIISNPNLARLRGRVNAKGAVRVSVAVPGKFAAGSGRLTRTSGAGRWSGHSENARCSGIWAARRF